MNWGSAASFGWVALAGLVLAFYLLRPRRQRIVVASLLVWRRTISQREADGWLAWFRRRAVLLFQLLTIVLVALALARPEQLGTVELGSPVALVMDTSPSMAIEADGSSRMDKVRTAARRLLQSLDESARITVIAAGRIPRVLVVNQTDRVVIDRSLEGVSPESSVGQVDLAIDVARSIADPDRGGQIYLFTDSASGDPTSGYAGVRLVGVGSSVSNVGLDGLEVRRGLNIDAGVQALVIVRNDGSQPVDVSLRVSPGSKAPVVRNVRIGPRARTTVFVDDLPVVDTYIASVISPSDVFDADDDVFATLHDEMLMSVMVVGEDPDPIVRVLQSFPGVSVVASGIDAFREDPGVADLYVFEGFVPAEFPPASVVLVRPPDVPVLALKRKGGQGLLAIPRPTSPIMRAIDARDIQLLNNIVYTVPDWASADIGDASHAVVGHGILDGRRTVFVGLDLVDAGVSQAFWYPMFWANVLRWADPFRPLPNGTKLVSADPVQLVRHPQADRVVVVAPDGSQAEFTDDRVAMLYVTVPGPYSVQQFSQESLMGEATIEFSPQVRRDAAMVSNVPLLMDPVETSKTVAQEIVDLAPWFVGAAFLVLVGEWWLFNRIRGVR
ncbi:MAG: hypothetical protein CL790_04705 [Chloroflexi bacterium]|nr:hypothetical protein [Chloroflexota bacterium]HCU73244.1 hypothetical protein [Chloroflexota bacterium]|tara:strand:- start:3382 stop:5217 length:1836 start_codon:yes stop_codon:yes gene_type:complete